MLNKYSINFKELEFLEAPSTIYDVSQKFKERFSKATKSIKIFSGELHWMLYSHPDILNTLIEKHEQGVRITIIASPVISVFKRGNKKFNGILKLANDGVVELYRRDKILKDRHFIIIDDDEVWLEEHHRSLSPLGLRRERKITSKVKGFNKFSEKFSNYIMNNKKSDNPKRDFLLLIPSQIHLMRENIDNYENLNIKEIRNKIRMLEKN